MVAKRQYDSDRHHRRSARLDGYDYSRVGIYFVTVCCWEKECLLGTIDEGLMQLSDAGLIAEQVWLGLPDRFGGVILDSYVIMPNHLHGIVQITEREGFSPQALGGILRAYKSISAISINRLLGRSERPVWQRNYHEHIVRDATSLPAIREYIPERWNGDKENPTNG